MNHAIQMQTPKRRQAGTQEHQKVIVKEYWL
jgi:hypothetical protein